MHIKQSRSGSMEVICRDDSIKFSLTQEDKIRKEIINRVIKSKNKYEKTGKGWKSDDPYTF